MVQFRIKNMLQMCHILNIHSLPNTFVIIFLKNDGINEAILHSN